MKIKIPKQKSIKQQCTLLWFEIIKKRAGYTSELSGIKGIKAGGTEAITAHHIWGKENNRLRFDLENGICLINGKEHIYGVHNHNPAIAQEYQERINNHIGSRRLEYLKSLTKFKGKTDLKLTLIYLQQEMDKLQN
jgi:hypothetical protein